MAGPVLCRACGGVLVEQATDKGVQPLGSPEPIVFRRKTDFIICPECFAVYNARDILEPPEEDPGDPPDEDDVIARLERLAEEGPPAAPAGA